MISDIGEFLRFFEGVNRRAVRDVKALPADAESWTPPGGDGENAWDIGQIIGHMAVSRLYFASAYRDEGWIADPWPSPTRTREEWVDALDQSASAFADSVAGTPNDWLRRRVDSIDTPGMTFSAWRLLMMMVEHDVHHRSQVQTYAGMMGWPVQQIFGRSAEQVGLQQEAQRKKHR